MNQDATPNEMRFTSWFRPSGIIMLDGLKRNDIKEKQTGRNIFESLRDFNIAYHENKLHLDRQLISTAAELRQKLERFARDFDADFSYILHLECHGGKAGIELGDNQDPMSWNELRDLVGTLNKKSKCNVGLVLACCNGFGSIKISSFNEPAPCYFHLSHRGLVSAGILEDRLTAFYKSLLKDHDVVLALKDAQPFEVKYAEQIYIDLMYRVLHSAPRGDFIDAQINQILTGLLQAGGLGGNPDVSYNREKVKELFGTFEKLVKHFITSNMNSFFCGRVPAFDIDQAVKWIASGKTLK